MEGQTVDASALIAYYGREPGWETMARLLAEARRGRAHLAMHAVNVGEVYYRAYRRGGEARAKDLFLHLRRLPIRIHDRVSNDLLLEVGRLKGSYSIAYGDAFAVAVARLRRNRLVTTDRKELQLLERLGEIRCLWLR